MKILVFLFLPFISFAQDPYVDSLYREYQLLKERKAIMDDSVEIQFKNIEELFEKIRIGQEAAIELKKIREEIEEMKRIRDMYYHQIDSLNKENMRLEEEQLKEKKEK